MEMNMFKPEGVYVAMLTPFDKDGEINEGELRRIIDFLIEAGVHGLFPNGSVGESIHMSREEKIRMMEIVFDQSRGRVPVTPGIGSTNPRESILLGQQAKAIGCDAVVVMPPYFFPSSQGMIEKYFETIADGLEMPIILYNIPLFTPPLSYDLVERLARRKNIVGMKDSSGSMVDFAHFLDKIRLIGGEMSFLTGREETFLACLAMGGRGCMTATSGILPEIMLGIYNAWKAGKYEEARALQFSILLVLRAISALPFPLGFKLALETRGFNMGPPKQPLSDTEPFKFQAAKANIDKMMQPFLENAHE
jgi:N-acetylneuraminate lyase/4-hydroxy-tetrahydrodipicolinate synthase